ncbi:putative threonine--tRNA ligase, mitochondrial [Erysiphe neolycopersici]|uniref:threonine--tRNA ligase n=1 Tax=Erysiphe neolycopersici TaxID=212602 RepID=A0A420HYJ8_9PEZI|nr:putative threonine--tRNA ligase, mitochondrial [Erysiphe neolycopersici]
MKRCLRSHSRILCRGHNINKLFHIKAKSLNSEPKNQNLAPQQGITTKNSNQLVNSNHPVDYRELGLQQELFFLSKFSPGSPIFLPNGARIFNKLVEFLRTQYEYYEFQEVISPIMYKSSLWKTSGHWENYANDMYAVVQRDSPETRNGEQENQNEDYGLKPMNCPGHCLIFASKARSYRDLPLRYADFSPLHRNEVTGALSGLTRVRCFHQDDGHIFCRPSQIKEEIRKSLEFINLTYRVLGLEPYRLVLSTRPRKKYIGSVEEWEYAEAALVESLKESGSSWTINEGDGAFYGPKIDIIHKDTVGRDHQTATIQLDFQLPQRFKLHYQAPAPEIEQSGQTCNDQNLLSIEGPVTPILIHRAVLGSVERIMALLIEKYNGLWPFWLNPCQIAIITVNDSPAVLEYARQAKNIIQGFQVSDSKLAERHIRRGSESGGININVKIFDKATSVNHKIASAKRQRYGIIVLVGPKDIESQTLSVDFSGIPSRNQYTDEILKSIPLKAKCHVHGRNIKWEELECSLENIKPCIQDIKGMPRERAQVALPAEWLRSVVHELLNVYS